ncbi:MAG: transcription antitermination factor NusB [Acidimicrobiales bacterium]|nr:transcription antitermination factor NusB [Acidimicrobiales bacterium]
MVTAATRRDARERAVELLYESETRGVDVDDIVAALPLTPDAYALELAHGVTDHCIELDAVLGRHARNWPVARMAVTDRVVLRLGAFELATQPDVPTGAALSEAVELASRYGSTDETSRFVNGVLVAVGNEVRDTRPWSDIEVVVFDMDGVIRHWLPEYFVEHEERLGLEPGTIAQAAFADPGYRDVTVGTITAEEWARQIGEAVARQREADVTVDEVAELWLSSDWRVDDDVVELVGDLRAAGTTTAVFSNATSRLEADMGTMAVAGLFDHIANSSRLGLAKPEVAAFERVASDLEADPGHLLFIDDRDDNVAGAVEAGWHAVRMPTSAIRLGGVLRRLAIPGAPTPT